MFIILMIKMLKLLILRISLKFYLFIIIIFNLS